MSSASSASSSSSSNFDPRGRFQNWIETNASTNEWIAEIKDMYEASGPNQLAFALAAFKQVGYVFEKLNSDSNRAILRNLAPKVVDMADATIECNTDEVVSIEERVLSTTELVKLVFSYLGFKDLARCAQVNRKWREIAYDPIVSKQSAYNSSFSNAEWKRCFGEEVLASEEKENKKDMDSLPDDIGEILRSQCPGFKKNEDGTINKSVFSEHVLFRMNRTVGRTADGQEIPLTLNTLGELARKYFPNTEGNTGYRCIWENIVDQHGYTPIEKSCWVLMTKELLEGSQGKNFATQQAMVASLASDALGNPVYAVPKTLEATLGILTEYFRTTILGTPEAPEGTPGTRLLNNDGYARCQEETRGYEIQGNEIMWRNLVGDFALGGVDVNFSFFDFDDDGAGVVGSRKL